MIVIDAVKTGKNIKKLMGKRKMNAEELARLIGTRPNTVRAWEKGKMNPGLISLVSISEVFGVPLEAILSYSIKED